MTSETNLEKLQRLLRDMFQFDCADLDFGIYRIMNYKRDVIEKFITHDLPEAISEELSRGALADQSQAARELKETADQIRQTLGKDALDADGNLAEAYHDTPLGKKYLELQSKAAGGRGREALEALIFNHLFTFFGRYYQDGDFVSKRRYSKKQKYAIPYNGEEVYLYWANNDQYYVKTAEHFHDYSFTARGVTVHFKLTSASVEQDNVKGDKRFFLPRYGDMAWDAKAGEVVVPFEYRPLTEKEQVTYGKKNQQDKIIAEAVEEIPKRLKKAEKALAAVTAERHTSADGESVTFLQHHLRQYTRRNTSDFFIHKDLKGFLSRELDFYLKNEVLNLDEMEAAGEGRTEGWFQVVRVIKAIGGRIITFLAQIEDFQKMLWEKRKFVTETNYCITVQNVPEEFYPQIAACEAQWAEWKDLFHVDEEESNLFNSNAKGKKDKRVGFLKAHPTLVLDTKHFDQDFVDRLLACFDRLDGMTDGLLVHGENFQAVSLLQEPFASSIKAAYYDPPYNTSEETFLYKNSYRHSSWLAMMANRVAMLRGLFPEDGVLLVAIDDEEAYRLKIALDGVLGESNYVGTVVVQSNPRGRGIHSFYATAHDYYLVYAANAAKAKIVDQPLSEEQAKVYRYSDEKSEYRLLPFRRSGGLSTPDERPNSEFTLYYSAQMGRIIAVGGDRKQNYPAEYEPANILCALKDTFEISEVSPSRFRKIAPNDTVAILPVDSNGARRVWRWSDRVKILQAAFSGEFVVQDGGERRSVLLKDRIKEGRKPKTVWADPKYDASSHGTNLLQDILGSRREFGYPKSLYSTYDALHSVVGEDKSAVVLDAFAGSGTTAHAVIQINRGDSGSRKFLLVEMGQYFETVLLPRIKKVTFSPEWKDGKPKRMATAEEAERSPRIVKYVRLESYEDALNNIAFTLPKSQKTLEFDDYLLKYVLQWETKESETLLNVEKLARPFTYTLHIAAGQETRKKTVDIPETFNYLLGLNIRTRKVYDNDGRRYLVYRGEIDHRDVVVIWRETEGWGKKDLERDKKFVAEQKLAEGADEVFVNGDSFIPKARALEPVFKNRMFSAVEV